MSSAAFHLISNGTIIFAESILTSLLLNKCAAKFRTQQFAYTQLLFDAREIIQQFCMHRLGDPCVQHLLAMYLFDIRSCLASNKHVLEGKNHNSDAYLRVTMEESVCLQRDCEMATIHLFITV